MIKYVATAFAGILVGMLGSKLILVSPKEAAISVSPIAVVEDVEVEIQPAPAYMIVLGEVKNKEEFGAGYIAKLPPLYEKFGG